MFNEERQFAHIVTKRLVDPELYIRERLCDVRVNDESLGIALAEGIGRAHQFNRGWVGLGE